MRGWPAELRARSLACLAACLIASACGPLEAGMASVTVSLSADACPDYCVETLGASIHRASDGSAIGPERSAGCDGTLVFDAVPAGIRVVVRAWAADATGAHRLEGESAEITVVAEELLPVEVPLAPIAPPVVTGVSPDPVAPSVDGTELTVTGTSFGSGGGDFRVELDGTPLEVVDGAWTDTSLRVRVRPGQGGTSLRVVDCRVASVPYPVRVFSAPAGTSVLALPGCPQGLVIGGLAPVPGTDDLVLAASCGTVGYVQRILSSACALSAIADRTVSGQPAALAVEAGGGAAWAVLASPPALVRVPLDAKSPISSGPVLGAGATPLRIATSGTDAWVTAVEAGGATRLYRVRGATASRFDDVTAELMLRDVVASSSSLFLAARNPLGEGRLVTIDPASGLVRLSPLPGCDDPVRLAAGSDGAWAAVACGGAAPGVIAVHTATGEVAAVALDAAAEPTSLVTDVAGTLAFVWDGPSGNLRAIDLPTATPVAALALGSGRTGIPLARLEGRDVLAIAGAGSGEDGITLVSPFASGAPCP